MTLQQSCDNIFAAMQGRASGISIVSDATPGGEATVRIRGFGTTGNNEPLYVIDVYHLSLKVTLTRRILNLTNS